MDCFAALAMTKGASNKKKHQKIMTFSSSFGQERAPGSGVTAVLGPTNTGKTHLAIERMLATFQVDVVHLHGLDFLNYLPDFKVPVIVTLHLPPGWYPAETWQIKRPQTYLVCVSRSQAEACPPSSKVRSGKQEAFMNLAASIVRTTSSNRVSRGSHLLPT